MGKTIFISYSKIDRSVAYEMAEYFESKGIDCFVASRDIERGASYPSKIAQAIKECKAVVLIASEAINSSDTLLGELDIIASENKTLISLFIEEFELSYDCRYYIGKKKRVNAYPKSPRFYFDEVLDELYPIIYPVTRNSSSSHFNKNINFPKAYDGGEKYIFVSYAHKDTDTVIPIIDTLQKDGYRIWYDSGIEAGSEWPENIERHLKNSDCVMVCMSPSAIGSQNCRNEINLACSLDKKMLVVYLEETELIMGMNLQLNSKQSVFRYKHNSDEEFYADLKKASILSSCKQGGTKEMKITETAPKMGKSLFISYSVQDKEIAYDMVDYFEGQGVDCFIAPRDIEPGGSYASKLTRAICDSKAIVLIASGAINTSEHILNEVDIMVSENKFFVPFFIEEFEMSYDYRYYLGRKQRIIAYPGDPRSYFDKLLDALSSVITVAPKKKAAPAQQIKPALSDNTQKVFSYIPHRGIMINPEDQQRNVSFRTDTFINMLGGIYDEVCNLSDIEHAKKTFLLSGYSCGQAFAQRLNSRWDLEAQTTSLYEEKLRKWCEFDSDVGWGKFDINVNVNEETGDFTGRLTINECFIVDIKNKRLICEFVRGYCEGVIETLLSAKVRLVCKVCPLKNKFRNSCVFDIILED